MIIIIPIWIVMVVVGAILIPPSLFLSGVISLIGLIVWLEARQRKHAKKRNAAINKAVSELSREEQLDWLNREGRYSNSNSVPRNLNTKFMTPTEEDRWRNREGEFR